MYIVQAVGGELNFMVLIGGASKNAKSLSIHPEDGNCNVCRKIG
jgi:hypothetical protein